MDDPSQTPPPLPAGPTAAQWITILHLSALAGIFLVGFGHILGPLVIWLLKKQDVPGLDAAGKSVLNFQISWSIWGVLAAIIAAFGSCLVFPLAIPLILFAFWIFYVIKGAIAASNGSTYLFPLTLRLIS